MRNTIWRGFLLTATVALLAGCETMQVDSGYPDDRSHRDDRPYPGGPRHAPPKYTIDIPKGHFPPPGSCRIWYPGVEPGQQPPPGDCHDLADRVPPGACLVSRSHDNARLASVTSYDRRQPRVVIDVQWFEVDTGKRVSRDR